MFLRITLDYYSQSFFFFYWFRECSWPRISFVGASIVTASFSRGRQPTLLNKFVPLERPYELLRKIKFIIARLTFCAGRQCLVVARPSYRILIRVGSSTSYPYRDERSSFNWPIRHPTTNLIINVERETYRGWLLHANDSHFNTYCPPLPSSSPKVSYDVSYDPSNRTEHFSQAIPLPEFSQIYGVNFHKQVFNISCLYGGELYYRLLEVGVN